MALFKRGEVWWVCFTYNGKQVRKSTETTDKKLAKRIFDKLKGEIAEGKWFERPPGESITFRELMDKYLDEYSVVNKATSSHRRDKSLAAHLVQFFGDLYVTEISAKAISGYKVKRRKEGASPRTVNYELSLMSHAFNIAIREWEWLENNPVRNVSKEKEKNFIERWLSLEEENKLLEASPKWLQEIISFAISTGLRRGEILGLKWRQIDFNRRTLTIHEQKNRGVDTLPLNEAALAVLRARREVSAQGIDYVFCSSSSTPLDGSNVLRAFYIAAEKAGMMGFRFHDLRHTFATRLVQNGVDLYTVQRLGRWKSVQMVMRYAHHHSESLRAGAEVMDRVRKDFITILSQ
ncbi:MAG TPA: tyrosine-type recombinase/integrase [Geobacteraceae bacterium]|nr:tyrosine-type recombinase/integrase [Geobacteraceae bacterium]